MSVNSEDIRNLIISSGGLDARLVEVDYDWTSSDLDVEGRFFYLAFRDARPTVSEFIDFVFHRIPEFCLPGSELDRFPKLLAERGQSALSKSIDRARDLFIQASKSVSTGGELGELILYLLLEIVLEAPQLVAKMNLKTNPNMAVHGADGIHVRMPDDSEELHVIWGESKIYKNFSGAVSEATKSTVEFHRGGRDGRKRELEIIRDHISVPDSKVSESLLKYFDPYEVESNDVVEYNACFIGFEFAPNIASMDPDEIEEIFRQKYLARIESGCELIENKINEHNGQVHKYIFLLLPFENVAGLRKAFFTKLGVQVDD